MAQIRQRSGAGRTVGAFALGAVAGSVLGLLFAPASGPVTRKQLQRKLRELRSATTDLQQTATKKIRTARTWVMNHLPNGHARRLSRRRVVHA